jgi:hypothetical protein
MRPPLAKLSDLADADQAALRRKLIRVAAESRQAGWLSWEVQDPVIATARGYGVRLTAADVGAILGS